STHRRHEVAPRPEVLPNETPLPFSIHPSQMDRALALDEPDHLRHRILRRYRHKHMDVIRHQVPLFQDTLLLRCQAPKHLPKMTPKPTVQRPPAALRDEHDVVFALPPRVAQTLGLVHRGTPFRVLGGSRSEVSAMDTP